jgi:hypothetical protein
LTYGLWSSSNSNFVLYARAQFRLWLWWIGLSLVLVPPIWAQAEQPSEPTPPKAEFSASLVKRTEGHQSEAQVFVKGNRLRLEYKYAVRTELGLSSIEIIRLDKRESWFLLAHRRQILSSPIRPEEILPIEPQLPGERTRTLLGDASATGRPAKLYEVRTDYNGRDERFYEWVDVERGIVLKLVSQDRDWSIEYRRIRFSPQPDYYFDEPVGYKRWMPPSTMKERG